MLGQQKENLCLTIEKPSTLSISKRLCLLIIKSESKVKLSLKMRFSTNSNIVFKIKNPNQKEK